MSRRSAREEATTTNKEGRGFWLCLFLIGAEQLSHSLIAGSTKAKKPSNSTDDVCLNGEIARCRVQRSKGERKTHNRDILIAGCSFFIGEGEDKAAILFYSFCKMAVSEKLRFANRKLMLD